MEGNDETGVSSQYRARSVRAEVVANSCEAAKVSVIAPSRSVRTTRAPMFV